MQKRFATIFLATALIAVMVVGMQIESVDAKKSQGTYNQKYGAATKQLVCGDRLCSEIGQVESPNISAKTTHDSMRDHANKKHSSSSNSITGAVLKSNIFDRTANTVTVTIDAYDDGKIMVDIPQIRNVGMVIVDGEEWDDAYVHGNSVKVYFYAGTEKIEIIGN